MSLELATLVIAISKVKCGKLYSDWGVVKGDTPKGSAQGSLLLLIICPIQVQCGVLLQFADDSATCLIAMVW